MGKGKDKEDGPSKNALRGLSYTQEKPNFLRNIATALGGATTSSSSNGRPPIPTRPDDDPNGDPEDDEEDGFHNNDLGEEAPQVVVLKEGRHMTAEEAELAKKDVPLDSIKPTKRDSSLRFSSSSTAGKRKSRIYGAEEDEEQDGDSFDNLLKRAKTDPTAATLSDINKRKAVLEKPRTIAETEEAVQKKTPLTKEEKSAMKAKRKASKKLLSFED